jgi:hypothetical protein
LCFLAVFSRLERVSNSSQSILDFVNAFDDVVRFFEYTTTDKSRSRHTKFVGGSIDGFQCLDWDGDTDASGFVSE